MTIDRSSSALALKALQMLGRWSRFTSAFELAKPRCPCCIGLGIQSIDELELDLVNHLGERHVGDDTVARLLREGAGYQEGAAGSATKLLQAIVHGSLTAPLDAQWMLVNDIEAALDRAERTSSSTGSDA